MSLSKTNNEDRAYPHRGNDLNQQVTRMDQMQKFVIVETYTGILDMQKTNDTLFFVIC